MKSAAAGLELAIVRAGGITPLARRLGVSPQAVAQWKLVPLRRVVEVEIATGVPRERLRPDFYRQEKTR
jgi:DNA-binding transcriptional regulator YdaS (Cro superfamily)